MLKEEKNHTLWKACFAQWSRGTSVMPGRPPGYEPGICAITAKRFIYMYIYSTSWSVELCTQCIVGLEVNLSYIYAKDYALTVSNLVLVPSQ